VLIAKAHHHLGGEGVQVGRVQRCKHRLQCGLVGRAVFLRDRASRPTQG
jgi:hypothetical protein